MCDRFMDCAAESGPAREPRGDWEGRKLEVVAAYDKRGESRWCCKVLRSPRGDGHRESRVLDGRWKHLDKRNSLGTDAFTASGTWTPVMRFRVIGTGVTGVRGV